MFKFIIGLFISFFILMAGMVIISINQKDIFLVSPTYYNEELAYQTTIDALNRTPQDCIQLDQSGKSIVVTVATKGLDSTLFVNSQGLPVSLKVELRRPDNAKLDRDINLSIPTDLGAMRFAKPMQGQWRVYIRWKQAGQDHLWRTTYYIN
jgi:nitrogen fixation protein FixH